MAGKATERLKKLEADHESQDKDYWCQMCGWDGRFLLRAFQKMMEIAINEWSDNSRWPHGEEAVDELFEEAMGRES